MRQLLSTTDRSLIESLLIALDSEGIEAVVHNDTGSSLPFVPVTVVITDDTDYERALVVLRNLQATVSPSLQEVPWFSRTWRLALLAILALILVLCLQSVG